MLAMSQPSTVNPQHYYYHADGKGNITAMVNSQQVTVAKYFYDAFGNTLALSGPLATLNSYRFSSKEYHQNSGLVYFLYRFYDPNLQRWLNRDPIGESGGDNLFAYAMNAPVNTVDPEGFEGSNLLSSAYNTYQFGSDTYNTGSTIVNQTLQTYGSGAQLNNQLNGQRNQLREKFDCGFRNDLVVENRYQQGWKGIGLNNQILLEWCFGQLSPPMPRKSPPEPFPGVFPVPTMPKYRPAIKMPQK